MGVHAARACEALDRGCCLELYYPGRSALVEPHAVGLDAAGRAWLLGFERHGAADPGPGSWVFLPLDEAGKVDVSGYMSLAPRPGFRRDDPRFATILAQL
jgi:hypothetical protein